jgi:FtsP/CotA-like multicopper oxidase with cupredoxin domain
MRGSTRSPGRQGPKSLRSRAWRLALGAWRLTRSLEPSAKRQAPSAAVWWVFAVAGAAALTPAAAADDALAAPPVLENVATAPHTVEVRLRAAPTRLSLLPGTTTDVWAYNGSVPGPTIEAREGDRVIVHFQNDLPEASTIHWHGIHLPANMDGSPLDPVPSGGSYDYVFTLHPGTAGTYWYHPHPHHRTGFQVAQGLFGAFIVREASDPLAALPEKLLILTDNRFRGDGAIDLPHHGHPNPIDEANGREGDVLFVNGQIRPTLAIGRGEMQRWRIINASAGRFYRLALSGHTFLHVGSDGGLFERPVARSEVLLAVAERVELLVQGTGAPGSRSVLQTLPYDRYVPQTRPLDWDQPRDLLTLQTTAEAKLPPPAIPQILRPIPPLDPAKATATRLMVLFQGFISGKLFDENRVDVAAPLGATEIWQLENPLGMDHPFHLHGFQFQVLDRSGVPEPFPAWKDTVNVPKGEMVRFIVRYDDYPGKWMFHCHILDHEDHGMMGLLEVR